MYFNNECYCFLIWIGLEKEKKEKGEVWLIE